jgi:integrase/recombinase XerC
MLTVRNRDDFRSKSGHERSVPLAGEAVEVLERLKQESETDSDEHVLKDRRGKPIKPDRISSRFKTFARKAKLDERIHFHSLRHTCGAWLTMKGVPLRVTQEVLGHQESSTTEIYSHLQPGVMKKAMQETFGDG